MEINSPWQQHMLWLAPFADWPLRRMRGFTLVELLATLENIEEDFPNVDEGLTFIAIEVTLESVKQTRIALDK